MTTEEAKNVVEAAENDILYKHKTLCKIADKTEEAVASAASSTSTKKTMTPFLVLAVIGLILLLTDNIFMGIVAIGAGIWWARSANQSAKEIEGKVTDLRKSYKSTINKYRKI